MTTTLRPHDFFLSLSTFADRNRTDVDDENHGDILKYVVSLRDNWDKWRFAETNELSFAYLRNWAIDNAPDAEVMQKVVELIDAHIEECLTLLYPEHGTYVRKAIGIPEPVKEEPEKES